MKNPFRNLRKLFFRAVGKKIILFDGVWIDLDAIESRHVQDLILKDVYELDERRLLPFCVRPNDVVLELGAGIGVIGLLAAKLAHNGRVISYEANTRLDTTLARNYSLNELTPSLYFAAIVASGESYQAQINIDDNVLSSRLGPACEGAMPVSVSAVRFNQALKIHNPNVLIVDIEGMEEHLFENADLSTIERVLIELHPQLTGIDKALNVERTLNSYGLKVVQRSGRNILATRQKSMQ